MDSGHSWEVTKSCLLYILWPNGLISERSLMDFVWKCHFDPSYLNLGS
jgi:hypothetical protein